MPLPIILGIAAGIAGATGIGTGIHGGVKMKEAKDTMDSAKRRMEQAQDTVKKANDKAIASMDKLGTLELQVMNLFTKYQDCVEKIHNRPDMKQISHDKVGIPKYDPEDLKKVSIGAGILLGGLGGAAVGTAGGIAAAGGTTAAVMALGTASTGTAIATLSGAAATNATLAALGGGAIAAGGGGVALGTTILGASTLGVGLLVGGIIFNVTGSKMSDKADDAWRQATKAKKQADSISEYCNALSECADKYYSVMETVKTAYDAHLYMISSLVSKKNDYNDFTESEKTIFENTYLLTSVLYFMCKVNLVLKSDNESELNTINSDNCENAIIKAETVLKQIA